MVSNLPRLAYQGSSATQSLCMTQPSLLHHDSASLKASSPHTCGSGGSWLGVLVLVHVCQVALAAAETQHTLAAYKHLQHRAGIRIEKANVHANQNSKQDCFISPYNTARLPHATAEQDKPSTGTIAGCSPVHAVEVGCHEDARSALGRRADLAQALHLARVIDL